MTAFSHSDDTLAQVDRELRELTRGHGQVLNLDAFRRHLEHPSDQHTGRQTPPHSDTPTAQAESQLRHELNLAFTDLGAATFALAHHGALNDPRLAPRVRHIRELFAQLDALERTTPISASDHSAPAQHAATA